MGGRGVLHLLAVTPLAATPVVVAPVLVACVIIVVVGGCVIAVIDSSRGRNERGSGQTHLCVFCESCESCGWLLCVVIGMFLFS